MKKEVIITIFVLLIGVSVAFGLTRQKELPLNQSPATAPSEQSTAEELNQAVSPGSYIPYSEEAIAGTAGQKFLFFHAPWCSQCRSIESGINAQGVPEGLTILKVDYDTNQDLRRKYGVTLQTTFVKVDDQGNFISKYVAYDEPTFDAVKRNYLQ